MKKKPVKTEKKTSKKIVVTVVCFVAAGLCLAVLTGAIVYFRSNALKTAADKATADKVYSNGMKAIGMINGEPFFQPDLDVYAAGLQAVVAAHYGQKYHLNGMGADFWDTAYDGSTPREFLNRLALDDLKRNMVLIQEARERGLDTPRTYNDLEGERIEWNEPSDEIVYGPKTYAPAEYNSYRISGIKDELMTALLKKELSPTTAQMRAAYSTLPDEVKVAYLQISAVRFSWDEGVSGIDVYAVLEAALKENPNPEAVAAKLADSVPGFSQEVFDMHSRFVSREDPYERELADRLRNADKGALVRAPEERPELFYITNREGGHIMPFEEAPGLGRNKWINDQFEIFMRNKIKAARVTLF